MENRTESREKNNDAHISDWDAVRCDDHGRSHLGVRNSGQRFSLANGDPREMTGGFEIGNPPLDDAISLEFLEEGRNRGLHYHDRGDSE